MIIRRQTWFLYLQSLTEKAILKKITVIKCGKFCRRGRKLLYKCSFKLMLFC